MENGIWTIFHRTGDFTMEYAPVWQRFVCRGGMAESVQGVFGDGMGKNRLTLRIRNHFARLYGEDGSTVSAETAGLTPGDLVAAGEVSSHEGIPCWRITSVAAEPGIGLIRGIVITAE
ncbi:MAG: hypothetical protein IKY52_06790 [Clostridia bacterium]|nr:hypothetical protein [Clostridia bacterium]